MFKQIMISGIVGAGLLFAGPALSHNKHGYHSHEFEVIQPVTKPTRPAKHCVSGKRVDNLQAKLKHKIKKGARQGKLVGWELKQVKKQQRKIRKSEKQMRHSGHCLTRKEVNKLLKRLDRAGDKIRKLKRNKVRWTHGRNHRHDRGYRNQRAHR